MKILLLLVLLGFFAQLWSAVIAGRGRGDSGKRMVQAAIVWVPLIVLLVLGALGRNVVLAAVLLLGFYVWMAYSSRTKRVRSGGRSCPDHGTAYHEERADRLTKMA